MNVALAGCNDVVRQTQEVLRTWLLGKHWLFHTPHFTRERQLSGGCSMKSAVSPTDPRTVDDTAHTINA